MSQCSAEKLQNQHDYTTNSHLRTLMGPLTGHTALNRHLTVMKI